MWKCSYVKNKTQKIGIKVQEIMALNSGKKKKKRLAIRKNFFVIRIVGIYDLGSLVQSPPKEDFKNRLGKQE